MIQTVIFRLYPSKTQEKKLDEIFTIHNRMKRIGYKILFNGENNIQQKLMARCRNNPYVNTILIENNTKLDQQKTWLKKRVKYMRKQYKEIEKKIKEIKETNKRDRRLKGLYSRLSSVQNRLDHLKLKPIVFGGKRLFREKILGKISEQEFQIKRDSSFCCVGKKQGVNLNIKILDDQTLKIHTYHKDRNKKWLIIPFSVNQKQEIWFRQILIVEKYTITIVRRIIKGDLRHFAHVSYEIPKPDLKYGFKNGAIGLDFNYNFVSLCNVDKKASLKSYQEIKFGNLHLYRKDKRMDYISYKMDKVVNYCINKRKGLIIEDLSFEQNFSYNKKLNRKLSNFKKRALDLLERKCIKEGVSMRKVYPAYTSLIGKYKYLRSHNLSTHVLASYVIARRGLGFGESIPHIYKWLLSQVGGFVKPRLKKGSPYRKWSQIHDFFKHSGITSFKTSDVMRKASQMKDVLNSVTSAQPDNLKAGLSNSGKIEDWNKFWNFIEITNFL